MENKILGALYGLAIGDAIGMPPELWSRENVRKVYGRIEGFLDGNPDNPISWQYRAGQFTDDTAQALILLDSLMANNGCANPEDIAVRLLEWAKKENAFENNILGPTSKAVLQCYMEHRDPTPFTASADTNGAAMRIPPIGLLFSRKQSKELCDLVIALTSVTHASDVALAGACMTAMAVASSADGADRDEMIEDVLSVEEMARRRGASTPAPSLSRRILWGTETARKLTGQDEKFSAEIYDMIGAGHFMSETVPAAISIAYYCMDVKKCALMCANLGGDTDTIGAIATAICGAKCGIEQIPDEYISVIRQANDIDMDKYKDYIMKRRGEQAG